MINSAATSALGFPTSFGLQNSYRSFCIQNNFMNAPEKELTIQIANIYCVHVNDMNVFESG